MNISDSLERLKNLARKDSGLKQRLLDTQKGPESLDAFCRISTEAGVPLSPIDIIDYGEDAYAAMRRSTNGGGENSPMLAEEDDYYSIFMAELEEL